MTADPTQPRVNGVVVLWVVVVTDLGLDNSAAALTGHTSHRDPSVTRSH